MRLARLVGVVLLSAAPMGCDCGGGVVSGDGEDAQVVVRKDAGQPEGGDDGGIVFVRPDAGCPTVMCGQAGTCCAEGEECVDEACLPACPSKVRCADTCCDSGSVCLSDECVVPGTDCKDSFDCDETEFCEPTLGQCLPQPTGSQTCEWKPPTETYAPTIEWSWTSSTIHPESVQVINMPVVIDLDGDAVPDVVFVTSAAFGQTDPAYLRAVDGKTGHEKWAASADVYLEENQLNPRGTPAAGDLTGDGESEIVALRRGGGVIAFKADGSLLWRAKLAGGADYTGAFNSGTVSLADLDGDGSAEIVVGGVVLDASGTVVSGAGRELAGTNTAGYGAVSIAADVDGDGAQEVVTGKAAFNRDGTAVWDCSTAGACATAALSDGYPAIADFNGDGSPELVVVSAGSVRVQRATTGALLAQIAMPGTGSGGPPTIADFDADGQLEIAAANGNSYDVFRYSAQPAPALSVKWGSPTQDLSSNVTGSSVFDFEGDGAAEVVYNDECYLRVYSGQDGTVLFQQASSSGTIHEYPVLVDVDGDNNTEIVIASNDANHVSGATKCTAYSGGEAPRHGVFVYGDSHDRWVRTRKLWNQHAYHLTNVNSDGRVPAREPKSWASGGPNTYRVSSQGSGTFNAPNLQLDLEVSTAACPASLTLRARVKNAGSLGVGAGVAVSFYLGTSASGTLIGSASTTAAILPGGSEVVVQAFDPSGESGPFSFYAEVDTDASAAVHECDEGDNDASVRNAACPQIN